MHVQPPSKAPRTVLGIAGSLRRNSFNRRLLEAAGELLPPGMVLHVDDSLGELSHFDEDLERATSGGPEAVRRLRDRVAAADALLIATPEYNQSFPGALKRRNRLALPARTGAGVERQAGGHPRRQHGALGHPPRAGGLAPSAHRHRGTRAPPAGCRRFPGRSALRRSRHAHRWRIARGPARVAMRAGRVALRVGASPAGRAPSRGG